MPYIIGKRSYATETYPVGPRGGGGGGVLQWGFDQTLKGQDGVLSLSRLRRDFDGNPIRVRLTNLTPGNGLRVLWTGNFENDALEEFNSISVIPIVSFAPVPEPAFPADYGLLIMAGDYEPFLSGEQDDYRTLAGLGVSIIPDGVTQATIELMGQSNASVRYGITFVMRGVQLEASELAASILAPTAYPDDPGWSEVVPI